MMSGLADQDGMVSVSQFCQAVPDGILEIIKNWIIG